MTMDFHNNPLMHRLWLALAACWPLAWMAFMHQHPGPLEPPDPPSAPLGVRTSISPPVDTRGSQAAAGASQGSLATSSGVRMFWEIPEPGRVTGRLELEPGALPDDPLSLDADGD